MSHFGWLTKRVLVVNCPKSAATTLWLITKMIHLCIFLRRIAMVKLQRMVWWTCIFFLVYQVVFQSLSLDARTLLSCAYPRSHDVYMHVIYKSILKLHFEVYVAPFLSLFLGWKHGFSWQSSLDLGFDFCFCFNSYSYFLCSFKTKLRITPLLSLKTICIKKTCWILKITQCRCTGGSLGVFQERCVT